MSATAVRVALVSALAADETLMGMLAVQGDHGGIYDEAAPEGAPFPYVVLGGKEYGRGAYTFGARGKRGMENIRIYARPPSGTLPGADVVTAIYEQVERILDGFALDLGDYAVANGEVALVTTFTEDDKVTASAPARFTYTVMPK